MEILVGYIFCSFCCRYSYSKMFPRLLFLIGAFVYLEAHDRMEIFRSVRMLNKLIFEIQICSSFQEESLNFHRLIIF
jgi:hypothetical protein